MEARLAIWTSDARACEGAKGILALDGSGRVGNDLFMKGKELKELAHLVRGQLELIGEDPERDGLKRTPLRVAEALQFFTQAYTIGGANGEPQSSLLFYVMYIYTSAFQNFNMGYASAMSWLLFLAIMVCTAILILATRRWTYYER